VNCLAFTERNGGPPSGEEPGPRRRGRPPKRQNPAARPGPKKSSGRPRKQT
jgi:hypothetical protein